RFSYLAKSESTTSHIGVSMTPGAMALTLMRCLISSSPMLWVRLMTAAFAAPARLTREIDDLTPLAGGNHVTGNDLAGEQKPAGVDAKLAVEIGFGNLGQRRHVKDARSIHQDVDAPEPGDNGRGHLRDGS